VYSCERLLKRLFQTICHPELVEDQPPEKLDVILWELILRQAQDDRLIFSKFLDIRPVQTRSESLAPRPMPKHVKRMPTSFVSESIVPIDMSFDTGGMAQGEPGLPQKFRWRKKEFVVAEVLERWKEHGDCRHGSGERYLRKHGFRIRTTDGAVMVLYFQRSAGRGKLSARSRWRMQSIEDCAEGISKAD